MTIGARVLKTGMAVALAIYLSELFHFVPTVAAVASIFAIQPSVQRSWQQMTDQVQANVIGAGMALLALRVFGHTPIAVGLVCIAMILINIRLKMESTIGLTLVTVVVVMETSTSDIMSALPRILMVLIGMGSAFAVNVLIFPPRPRRQFHSVAYDAYHQLSVLLRTAISDEMKESVYNAEKEKLHGMLRKLEDRYDMLAEERSIRPSTKIMRARKLLMAKQMIKSLQKGADLLDVVEEHYFASPGADKWARSFDSQIEELTKYHEQILLKMDGKMKPHVTIEPEEGQEKRLADQLTDYLRNNPDERMRLVFVASGLFEYGFHLRRLERVVEQVLNRTESAAKKAQ
ncbi:FUSC family protein [Paenibacillus beijingensis]|uniref:Aromatic acid exporter family protein n=1 Tax=Paenibacillus beijingensis TaxID=1126833 RepID=A0A0D5NHR1_9BACL|nr:aromatic acid exporter family protein [Paenibacillus beijingensis]AJY74463.1 hypothetical protein VN24_07605 [Paenibacillus beijingensis]